MLLSIEDRLTHAGLRHRLALQSIHDELSKATALEALADYESTIFVLLSVLHSETSSSDIKHVILKVESDMTLTTIHCVDGTEREMVICDSRDNLAHAFWAKYMKYQNMIMPPSPKPISMHSESTTSQKPTISSEARRSTSLSKPPPIVNFNPSHLEVVRGRLSRACSRIIDRHGSTDSEVIRAIPECVSRIVSGLAFESFNALNYALVHDDYQRSLVTLQGVPPLVRLDVKAAGR